MNHRLASDVCRESPSYARSAKYNSWAKLAAFKEWTGEYQPAGFLVKFCFPASPSYFVLVYAPGVVFTLHSFVSPGPDLWPCLHKKLSEVLDPVKHDPTTILTVNR